MCDEPAGGQLHVCGMYSGLVGSGVGQDLGWGQHMLSSVPGESVFVCPEKEPTIQACPCSGTQPTFPC